MIKNKFNKIKYLLLTSFLATGTILFFNYNSKLKPTGKFQKLNSYSQVQDLFDNCTPNTLIIFDIDDTLITATDAFANDLWHPWYFQIIAGIKYPKIIFNKEKIEWIASMVIQQSKRYVFDPDVIKYIKQLQNQKCMVVALSFMRSSSVGIIKNLPEWRANMLKDFGIDFSGQFENASFTKLPAYKNSYPCLYKGILCTNKQSKGTTLGAFLDYYNLNPDKIIFFDDRTDQLNSVFNECKKRNIDFCGFQVLAAYKNRPTWNTNRALLQLDFIIKNSSWLSDEMADQIIRGQLQIQ
ncbi:DUF2608 domain-containing protein [Candidatus Dependentiae bacterium]|nr:DUF2608 domain-containing protein [Candidatus Dependentiae bacterium]MBU4387001.1 DUF2608 domain-containing protein [Candidatus Dependentiae bacterium]MCG2756671.1 DUF2608 domain-containing protein [Candidatus Dependentiae bacterium]